MSERYLRSINRRGSTSRPVFATILGLMVAVVGAACSGAGGGGGGAGTTTITLAAVDNPSMADLKQLVPDFQASHSNITVKIVTLPDVGLRPRGTPDLAGTSGDYD